MHRSGSESPMNSSFRKTPIAQEIRTVTQDLIDSVTKVPVLLLPKVLPKVWVVKGSTYSSCRNCTLHVRLVRKVFRPKASTRAGEILDRNTLDNFLKVSVLVGKV